MKTLTREQAAAIIAFYDSFGLRITGAWPAVEDGMKEDFGIEDPENEIEAAIDALR